MVHDLLMAPTLALYTTIFSSWLVFPLFSIPLFIVFLIVTRDGLTNHPPSPPIVVKIICMYRRHFLGLLPHVLLSQLSKKYGPIMLFQLGKITTLVISSAEMAKEVLKIEDHNFCNRPLMYGARRISYNYIDVIFAPYSEHWREMRKLYMLKLFSMKSVQSFRSVREEEVSILINSITSQCNSSASPSSSSTSNYLVINNLDKMLLSVSNRILFKILFGTSYQGEVTLGGSRFEEVIFETLDTIGRFSSTDHVPYIGWILDTLSGYNSRLEENFQKLDTFLEHFINCSLDPKKPRKNEAIIDILYELEKGQLFGGTNITRDHIKSVLVDIFVAGLDTTTVTMVWAMAELVKNPRSMKVLQDEVRSCVKKKLGIEESNLDQKRRVEESDLDQLPYLKMVVKETLRLHPPGPLLIPRENIKHCKIKGYDISANTLVLINAWAIGRDPKSWENPEMFSPERFMDRPNDFKGQNFSFLPFGAGRRGCPGISMGNAMMELTLANLLYSFNWELPKGMKTEDMDMEEGGTLAVHKKSGLQLVPVIYDPQATHES